MPSRVAYYSNRSFSSVLSLAASLPFLLLSSASFSLSFFFLFFCWKISELPIFETFPDNQLSLEITFGPFRRLLKINSFWKWMEDDIALVESGSVCWSLTSNFIYVRIYIYPVTKWMGETSGRDASTRRDCFPENKSPWYQDDDDEARAAWRAGAARLLQIRIERPRLKRALTGWDAPGRDAAERITGHSRQLIRFIDWRRFRPPICILLASSKKEEKAGETVYFYRVGRHKLLPHNVAGRQEDEAIEYSLSRLSAFHLLTTLNPRAAYSGGGMASILCGANEKHSWSVKENNTEEQ